MEAILLLCCLVIFLLAGLINVFRELKSMDYRNKFVLLMMRNNENICEGMIRSLFYSETGRENNLLIVDDNSSDKTAEIIKCIARNKGNVLLIERNELTKEGCEQVKDIISHAYLVRDLREKTCA